MDEMSHCLVQLSAKDSSAPDDLAMRVIDDVWVEWVDGWVCVGVCLCVCVVDRRCVCVCVCGCFSLSRSLPECVCVCR